MKWFINWGVVVILIIGFVIFFIGLYYLEQPSPEELSNMKLSLATIGLVLVIYAGAKLVAQHKEINKLKHEIEKLRHQK